MLRLRLLLQPRLPIGAKGDLRVTALAKGLKTGRLEIKPNSYAFRVEVEKDRAKRVLYVDGRGRTRSISAKIIVIACSAVDTPRLVLLSDMPRDLVNHDVVGRRLMVHHYPGGIGFFGERIDYYRGFWSMRCVDDFYLSDETGLMFGIGRHPRHI